MSEREFDWAGNVVAAEDIGDFSKIDGTDKIKHFLKNLCQKVFRQHCLNTFKFYCCFLAKGIANNNLFPLKCNSQNKNLFELSYKTVINVHAQQRSINKVNSIENKETKWEETKKWQKTKSRFVLSHLATAL